MDYNNIKVLISNNSLLSGCLQIMTVVTIIAILALAVLLLIAAELYVISRELSRGISLILKDRENREDQKTGQTINVNLTPTTAENPENIPPVNLVSEKPAIEPPDSETPPETEAPQEEIKPEPPKVTPVNPVQEPVSSGSSGGALSKKCKNCQAENSNYRRECFNCGQPL